MLYKCILNGLIIPNWQNYPRVLCYSVKSKHFHCESMLGSDECHSFSSSHSYYLFSSRLPRTFHLFWDCLSEGMASETRGEMDCRGWSWACGELGGSVFNLSHVQWCRGKVWAFWFGHTHIVLSVGCPVFQLCAVLCASTVGRQTVLCGPKAQWCWVSSLPNKTESLRKWFLGFSSDFQLNNYCVWQISFRFLM